MGSVLIVDDVKSMRDLLKAAVAPLGFDEIKEAETGAQAIELVEEMSGLELILLDYMLDDKSGVEVLKEILPKKESSGFKVCFITGKREKGDVMKALASGADEYILKPVDPGKTVQKLKKLLNRGEAEAKYAIVEAKLQGKLAGASIPIEFEITAVSEFGLRILSSMPVDAGGHLALVVPTLASMIGLEDPFQLKVEKCSKVDDRHLLETHFMGLKSNFVDSIRKLAIAGESLREAS